MSVRLALLVVAAAVAPRAPARAAPVKVRLVVEPGDAERLPFEIAQLEGAVALRVPLGGDGRAVRVRPYGGDVMVELGALDRLVPLAGRTGAAAARRVGLAIADLALAEARPPEAPELADAPAASPPPTASAPALSVDRAGPRVALALLATFSTGGGFDQLLVTGAVDGTLRLLGPLRAAVQLGAGAGPSAHRGGIDASWIALPLRLGLALRLPRLPLEVRVLAVLQPYRIAAADVSAWGATVGAGAAAMFTFPVARRLAVALALGVDLFVTRDAYTIHGQPALASERLALWSALGVALSSEGR